MSWGGCGGAGCVAEEPGSLMRLGVVTEELRMGEVLRDVTQEPGLVAEEPRVANEPGWLQRSRRLIMSWLLLQRSQGC